MANGWRETDHKTGAGKLFAHKVEKKKYKKHTEEQQ